MPAPISGNDIGRSLRGNLGGQVPALAHPFNLNLCGFIAWIIGGATLVAVIVALGFAVVNNPGHSSNRNRNNSEFEFEQSGQSTSPGIDLSELFESLDRDDE